MDQEIRKQLQRALEELQQQGVLSHFDIEKVLVEETKDIRFGEYTTNIAMVLAKEAGVSPRELGNKIAEALLANELYTVTVVGPGFINFTLTDVARSMVVHTILEQGKEYGSNQIKRAQKINNEFISANPTGPLHIGNGRGGFLGDSLTRVLRKVGHSVTSEYYINDGGEQIVKLGHSIKKDKEAVYGGEYIDELHEVLGGMSVEEAGQQGAKEILKCYIQKTIEEKMQIHFDKWVSEKALMDAGKVGEALAKLEQDGRTYEAEGATWLRTTEFGDDKDRVLKKQDGGQTYFASECGYILDKTERGFDIFIETFGADHHGYTRRFEAAARALGFTGEIHFILMQLVKLTKDGEEVRMSKRAGNVVAVDELIDLVGHDVARFFFLMYSPDTHMVFDLGLAEDQSQKNPVYYVQYAHARMASILRKATEKGLEQRVVSTASYTEKEKALVRQLEYFPGFVRRVADDRAPHRLTQYALSLADMFHSFYAACPVIDEENLEQTGNRLALVRATQRVLAETLDMIGVTAPEQM